MLPLCHRFLISNSNIIPVQCGATCLPATFSTILSTLRIPKDILTDRCTTTCLAEGEPSDKAQSQLPGKAARYKAHALPVLELPVFICVNQTIPAEKDGQQEKQINKNTVIILQLQEPKLAVLIYLSLLLHTSLNHIAIIRLSSHWLGLPRLLAFSVSQTTETPAPQTDSPLIPLLSCFFFSRLPTHQSTPPLSDVLIC